MAEQDTGGDDGGHKPEGEGAAPVPPGFLGNPDHLAKLKEGVKAWNQWRAENPDVRPYLAGIDCTRAEDFRGTPLWGRSGWDRNGPERVLLAGASLSGAKLWSANLSGADLRGANLSGAYLSCANLSSAYLSRANLSRAELSGANLSGAELSGANLSGADFHDANLSGADFHGANLCGAALWGANLSGAILNLANLIDADLRGANLCGTYLLDVNLCGATLWRADLCGARLVRADVSGAQISSANLTDADVSMIRYDRKLLRNRCHGIRAESCYGSALFKRDVMDQDYLDQIEDGIAQEAGGHPYVFRAKLHWLRRALANGFVKWKALLIGGVIGLMLALMLLHRMQAPFNRFAGLDATWAAHWGALLGAVIGGVALAGFFAGTLGKLLIFRLWGLFDYGRSWMAVLGFAALMIGLFGVLYYLGNGVHVRLEGEANPIWFFPWFVAAMGFCTLGISSYAEPQTNWGALLMTANVLAGFLTLGLLLSVLGNIFARRA